MGTSSPFAKKESKKSTIYDIANETKLSVATVSRIINRKGSFSARSEALVMEAVERLGYVPVSNNLIDVSRITGNIGLYWPHITEVSDMSDFLVQYLIGASDETLSNGYGLLLYEGNGETGFTKGLEFDSTRFDALLVPYTSDSIDSKVEEMISNGYPVAYTGTRLPGDMAGNHVYGGYKKYKREVLELLYSIGYRNIATFEMFHQARNLRRIETFRETLESFRLEKGLPEHKCRMVIYDAHATEQFKMLLQNILEDIKRPEVIFIDAVDMVYSAYSIIHKIGLRIPEDIGIISTSHHEKSGEEFSPPLSTVCVNAREMGRRCAQIVLSRLKGENSYIERDIPYKIHVRDSLKKRN